VKGITTTQVGRRIYINGNTYPIREQLKALGCKPEKGSDGKFRWWVGTSKGNKLATLLAADAPPPENPDTIVVCGRARYKGRSYYVRAVTEKDGGKLRLTTPDASIDFWVHVGPGDDRASWERRYDTAKTLGEIRRFLARRRNPDTRQGQCTECSAYGPAGDTCDKCYEGSYV
jgi:hypothetical protein